MSFYALKSRMLTYLSMIIQKAPYTMYTKNKKMPVADLDLREEFVHTCFA